MSRLTVVVPTRDRPGRLRRCLAALSADLTADDEIVVVDSASAGPAEVADAVGDPAGVRLLRCESPGASLARNAGWRAASSPIVAFVDDDVEVLPGWADAVVAAFGEPGVAFVTGWIGVPPEQAGVAEPQPLMVVPEAFRIDRRRQGPLGAGANLAALTTALRDVGGFDTALGPGTRLPAGEDHELLDRLLTAGFVGYYSPVARVQHEQWRSRGENLRLHWRIGLGAGARLARLAALDPGRLLMVAREVVVDDALAAVVRSVRDGYRTGTLFAVLRLLGTAAGLAAGPVLTALP